MGYSSFFAGYYCFFTFIIMCRLSVFSQSTPPSDSSKITYVKPIEADLLYSYYEQDGDMSPVTGGKGTQALTDVVSQIKINIPFKNGQAISVSIAQDQYSSASTDNVNTEISSASVVDNRRYGNINYSKSSADDLKSFTIGGGYSTEWDVNSWNANANLSLTTKNKLNGYALNFSVFKDNWELIYPAELRVIALQNKKPFVDDSIRYSYSGSASFERVLTKKLIFSVSSEIIFQEGLLSTPFHRVFFSDTTQHTVEYLPSKRIRYPISLNANYFLNDYMVVKTSFRSYYDTFGVKGQTYKLEFASKITQWLTLYPFGRYHKQQASKYYAPFQEHVSTEHYYTSDTDLATFESYQYGLGLKINPIYGILSFKATKKKLLRLFSIQSIDLRYAHYKQTTGLRADIISFGTKFKL